MLYHCLKFIARVYLFCTFKLEVKGLEHVPIKGAIIVAANHVSNHDPIILSSIFARKIHFLAKQELFRYRWSRWFFHKLHVIPVNRQAHCKIRPVRRCLNVIQRGDVFGIFPEGKRCKNGETVPPKPGVAFFSCQTGTPVLPVALIRTKQGLRRRVQIVIGPSVDVSKLGAANYTVLSHMIMENILKIKQKHSGYDNDVQPETV